MGHKFSLILSREITDEESETLRREGCSSAVFEKDTLPTNAEATVTKMDVDDADSESLAKAIESALEAVTKVEDLTVPALAVPAQPTGESTTVVEGSVVEEAPVGA